ncbi:TolC family protein, partial [Candidatus Latescibacterota bacterium]
MRSKYVIIVMVFFIFAILGSVPDAQENMQKREVTIGVVLDGPWDRNDEIFALFKKEIYDLLSREFDIRFPSDKSIIGDWTKEGVHSALERLITDPEVDIVLAGGILASAEVCQRSEFPRPVIAPFILDADLQGLPFTDGVSGLKNLNYVVSPERFETDIEAYRDIYAFKKPAMLISSITSELYPNFKESVSLKAQELGIDLYTIIVETSIEPALNALPSDIDAVIITSLYPLQEIENKRLIQGLIDRKLPGFTSLYREDVENGIYAGRVPDAHFQRRARRVALTIQRILHGEDAGTTPVVMHDNFRLIINMETARSINIYPAFSAMSEAELINPIREEAKRRVTLPGAINEAIEANLDLAAQQRSVAAGEQDIKDARSNLLPRIEVSALETIIDEENAEASMGQQAERTFSGTAKISQVLFSEPAWANFSIQKHFQTTREEELEAFKLDIANNTAVAYLDLLKAKTIENIQRENLKLIRTHLEIARVRKTIGISGPADVYRLESKIATSRLDVIRSNSLRNAREINLNRLLHHPLEESFTTEETTLEDVQFFICDSRVLKYFSDQWSFRVLRKFLAKVGLESSPELRGLDAAISARERALASAKRAYFMPTLGVQGELANKFSREGAGSNAGGMELPGGFSLPEPEDDSWWLGINLSLPLFEGGARRAAHLRSKEELRQLKIQRDSAAEQIEQRIRSALHFAGTSLAGINLSRDAAEAAHKGLELVEDSYTQGVVSIIDLLDAQNAALMADLAAANAEFNFLSDIMEVRRAVGRMDFSMTEENKDEFFRDMDIYFRNAKSSEFE